MKERLQKILSRAGLCSRRRAEEWIAQGKVTVNGDLARLGDTADPECDEILVDGRPLPAAPEKTVTVLLYKPRGVVTTLSDEKDRPTVAGLLPPELGRLYPVGRLDQFSEGLLLMTNDGELANRLTHPAGEVDKTYRLWVSGWHDTALEKLRRPIVLDGRPIAPPQVRLLWTREGNRQQATGNEEQATGNRQQATGNEEQATGNKQQATGKAFPLGGRWPEGPDEGTLRQAVTSNQPAASLNAPSSASLRSAPSPQGEGSGSTAALEITIHEGRNRQIRRMAQAAGLTVTRLKRVAEGPLSLGDLKPGEWRLLTETELAEL